MSVDDLVDRSSADTHRLFSVSTYRNDSSFCIARILDGFGWLIMYIHVSWSWRHLGILGHLFQVGIAVLALYIGNCRDRSRFAHRFRR